MPQALVRDFSLSDRYGDADRELFLTGLQALVRLPLEASRRDAAAGRRLGVLISGYEGSPLAGYDLELARQAKLLGEHGIVFRPGVNEELAANVVQGSQLASASSERTTDGVLGIWYGKAPGLDRATDALRHANLGGADPDGGALVLVGDDSIAKSSTIPSSSEVAMAELGLPILVPSDPQEILDFGLHGIAMSRFSGLWVGLKLATNLVDGSASVSLQSDRVVTVTPSREIDGSDFRHEVSAHFMQPLLGDMERSLHYERSELALRYVRANNLNSVKGDPQASLGIVAAGMTHRDVLEALGHLGFEGDLLDSSGVKILQLAVINPVDRTELQAFATGLEEVLVIEEKRPFVEHAVKDALFGSGVRVVGKLDESGAPLVRANADLPPEFLASVLRSRIERTVPPEKRTGMSENRQGARPRVQLPLLTRTPYFCSGCPHNLSTVVPTGAIVGAGIGCHTIAKLMPSERVGDIVSLSQMGGEGAPWIGMAPFVSSEHLFQNLGDGTYHHSGSLAVRAAVAAQVNITYKLLYNSAVAMTGGQDAVGKMSVPMIARELLAEGVRRVVITTDDTRKYRRERLPRGVKVRDRSHLMAVQEELSAIRGVTVLIHDQECATELRRKRKRGTAVDPTTRVFINERVCEGCGDCGQKSNCMSVQPVDTPFGRKTAIDQGSCNKDYSCLAGDCPSFVKVTPSASRAAADTAEVDDLPEPPHVVDSGAFNMRITGVGGTGVVTTAQILATAGTLAGLHVRGLDQLGLAQKGGAVVSDLRFSARPIDGTNKLAAGTCDLYLGCDILVAASDANLGAAAADRTVAVVSTSRVPTGAMILRPETPFPSIDEIVDGIDRVSRKEFSVYADARAVARASLGSDQFANMVLVGMAYQAGALPLPMDALVRAVTMNGVAVQGNLRAIAIGRQHVIDPTSTGTVRSRRGFNRRSMEFATRIQDIPGIAEDLRDRVGFLARDLHDYQDARYAQRYVDYVSTVSAIEGRALGTPGSVTQACAESMHKLMAYKDEYEVARLYLDPSFKAQLHSEFGPEASFAVQLHPPVLRAIGLRRKLSFGPWFTPILRVLRSMRRIRGSVADPFGYAHIRRVERELVSEFEAASLAACDRLSSLNRDDVLSLLRLPDTVRGYEHVKLANIETYRGRMALALSEIATD